MINFTSFFLIFSLGLSFWGSHALRLLKIDQGQKPTIMLKVTTGIALLLFFGQALYAYDLNLTYYLWGYFLIGVIGFLADFFVRHIRAWSNTGQKWAAIKVGLATRDAWLASLVIALTMSMIYSAMWPSGHMEGWVNNGADFHHWIFMAEYKLGLIDPVNSQLTPVFPIFELDGVGTQILIAFVSVAFAQFPHEASPAIVLTFLVWFGSAVYILVRQVFKLQFFQSIFISIALCLGSFVNYVALIGMFGHLLSLFLFIVILTQITNDETIKYNYANFIKKLFFPLFALFLSYQAGYILYSSFTILALFFIIFFSLEAPFHTKFFKGLCLSWGAVLAVTAICSILMPGLAYHFLQRNIEISHQQAGWPIPFVNPLLFSGLPFYLSTDQFKPVKLINELPIYSYFPLILFILFFAIIIYLFNKKAHKNYVSVNINYIFSLVSIYIISIIFYLIIYYLFSNIYRIWKFSAYIILPLSFINLSLLIYTLSNLNIKFIIKIINIFLCLLAVFYASKIFNYKYFIQLQQKYYQLQPNYNLQQTLYSLDKQLKDKILIFNYKDASLILNTSIILSKSSNKLIFYPSLYFIAISNNYINYIRDNTFFITDIDYDNILNSTKLPPITNFKPFNVYNFEAIKEKGLVQMRSNFKYFPWKISNYPISYKFILPSRMINQDIIFSISLSPGQEFSSPCDQIEFGLHGSDKEIIWLKKNIDDPYFLVPAAFTANINLEIFTKATFIKGEKCTFDFDRVDLSLN
jgi:hypothetical protein